MRAHAVGELLHPIGVAERWDFARRSVEMEVHCGGLVRVELMPGAIGPGEVDQFAASPARGIDVGSEPLNAALLAQGHERRRRPPTQQRTRQRDLRQRRRRRMPPMEDADCDEDRGEQEHRRQQTLVERDQGIGDDA